MFSEIAIAGNRVIKNRVEAVVTQPLLDQVQDEFKNNLATSIGYPTSSNVYQFRTPIKLDNIISSPGYQWSISESDFFLSYKNALVSSVSDYLNVNLKVTDSWVLLQTNDKWIHNPIHQHLTASWIGVLYLKTNVGDSIKFVDDAGNEEDLEVSTGDFVLFPATAKHKPNSNCGDENRISLNMELLSYDLNESSDSERRLSICNTCENLNVLKMCNKCMCFMPLKTKLKNAVCPIALW